MKFFNKRTQIATEFIFVIGVILFLFIALMFIYTDKRGEISDTQDFLNARNECLKFSNFITSVYNSGGGTSVITSTDYVISIVGDRIIYVNEKFEEGPTNLAYKLYMPGK